jgi:hypothetical protein
MSMNRFVGHIVNREAVFCIGLPIDAQLDG